MSKIDTGQGSAVCGEALEPYRRIKLDGANENQLVYADAGEDSVAVSTTRTTASGELVSFDYINKPGTFEIEASEAITVNAAVYGADDGKIKATASGNAIGFAREAATGDGSVIEVWKKQTEE